MIRKLFDMNKINLRPIHQMEVMNSDDQLKWWRGIGDDSQCIIEFQGTWKNSKWYCVSFLEGSLVESVKGPKLYFDTGSGFSEDNASGVQLVLRNGMWEFCFKVPPGTLSVRYDPSELPFEFGYRRVAMKEYSEKAWMARQIVTIVARKLRQKKGARNLLLQSLRVLKHGGLSAFRGTLNQAVIRARAQEENSGSYFDWIEKFDYNPTRDRLSVKNRLNDFNQKPLISVVMPVYNPPIELLDECIRSVANQVYENWEFCIADDCSPDPNVRELLQKWQSCDERIKVVCREENGHISAASNTAASIATGEWIALLDHDDILPENALAEVVIAISENPEARMIYSDEDKIDEGGFRKEPYFKTDWNYHLFLSQNMFSHLGVYSRELFQEVGGFRIGLEGAQDYDLALRCIEKVGSNGIHHISRVLYHWRQLPGSTSVAADEKPYAMLAGERALNEHFIRSKIDATAELIGHGYNTKRRLPKRKPKISIIIPNKNSKKLLETCLGSIFNKTNYDNYEILIVDNGSDDENINNYYKELSKFKNLKIVYHPGEFNFSAICNFGVSKTKSRFVVLLNNDVEVINGDWLSEMVSIALQPNVGAVGARLWYPDNTLQHAGLVLSPHHIAMNAHRLLPQGHHGYFGRASLTHECSAVTAACLLVEKIKYNEVGGLDEVNLKVAYNDVDFCLKLKSHGYKNVCANMAELYHHESASRESDSDLNARFLSERTFMKSKWESYLASDEMYNPNLSLERDDFSLQV